MRRLRTTLCLRGLHAVNTIIRLLPASVLGHKAEAVCGLLWHPTAHLSARHTHSPPTFVMQPPPYLLTRTTSPLRATALLKWLHNLPYVLYTLMDLYTGA